MQGISPLVNRWTVSCRQVIVSFDKSIGRRALPRMVTRVLLVVSRNANNAGGGPSLPDNEHTVVVAV